jgi:DNA-binding PucR family transcriptional regulator
VRVALGEPAPGVAGFRASHEQAKHARRIATLSRRSPGSVTHYGRVALQAMATADLDQAQAFVEHHLGHLAAGDDTTRRLLATLRVYLDEHAGRGRTAKRLGVHENTVSYRIRQAEEILGRSVESDTLDLRVALALTAVVGAEWRHTS